MQTNRPQQPLSLPLELDGNLVLRRSTPDDAERLGEFNAHIHGENEQDARAVAAWTRDLLSGKHPTFGVHDFTIVEERSAGKIVSSMNLISQTWAYAGIPFGVGRPELVGTEPEYRNRGLVRKQFEVVHAWSAERGELLQGITGIPYYYRQFGYEMTVNLSGESIAYPINIPHLEQGQPEPFQFRDAQESDLPFIAGVYDDSCKRSLLAARWDAALWRHELLEKSPENVNLNILKVIQTPAGEPVGYLSLAYGLSETTFALKQFELKPGASWPEIAPAVLRYVFQYGQSLAKKDGKELQMVLFQLGGQHPAYEALKGRLPQYKKPYAWYIRVPDLPGFLRLITPVLEERLKGSLFSGYTGELKLGFYRSGLRLAFNHGRIESIIDARFNWEEADAAFPGLTFLHILFGYRSLEQLEALLPDCFAKDSKSPLISTLFPRQNSCIQPIS